MTDNQNSENSQGTYPPNGGASAAPNYATDPGYIQDKWFRSQNRLIGGVCAGIAERLNIDPVIVRGLAAVGLLFFGWVPVLYGALWLAMPNRSTGLNLWQERKTGMPTQSGAVAAAIVIIVLGFFRMFPQLFLLIGFVGSLGNMGMGSFAVMMFCMVFLALPLIALVVLIVWLVNRNKTPYQPTPAASTGSPITTTAAATTDNGDPEGLWNAGKADNNPNPQPAPGYPTPPSQAPRLGNPSYVASGYVPPTFPSAPLPTPGTPEVPAPRIPGPSRTLSLTVGGLILLAVFLGILLPVLKVIDPLGGMLLSVGLITVVLGVGMLVAALQKRRTGWLAVATPLVVVLLTMPVATLGMAVPQLRDFASEVNWSDLPDSLSYYQHDLHPGDTLSLVRGRASIDLRHTDPGKPIEVKMTSGDVVLYTLPGQNLDLSLNIGNGEVTTSLLKDNDWVLDSDYLNSGVISEDRPQYFTMDGSELVEFVDRTKSYEAASMKLGSNEGTKVHLRSGKAGKKASATPDSSKTQRVTINLAHGSVVIYERPPQDLWNGVVLPDGHFLVEYVLSGQDLLSYSLQEYLDAYRFDGEVSEAARSEFTSRALDMYGSIEKRIPGGIESVDYQLGGNTIYSPGADGITLTEVKRGKKGPWTDSNRDGFNDRFQPGGANWTPGDNFFDEHTGRPYSLAESSQNDQTTVLPRDPEDEYDGETEQGD